MQYGTKAGNSSWKTWLGALMSGVVCVLMISADFSEAGISEQYRSIWRLPWFCYQPELHHLGLLGTFTMLFWAAGRCLAVENLRNRCWLAAVSLVFGLLNAGGQLMYYTDHLSGTVAGNFTGVLTSSVIFFATALLLLTRLPMVFHDSAYAVRGVFCTAFLVIMLGWLPWIISYYPCSADYDVYVPIMQYMNRMDRSNNFPWFYSTVVGYCYSLGLSMGDLNLGLFLHIGIRAPIMAAIYAFLAQRLWKAGARKSIVWGVILLYALVPVWGAYSKHGFKDVEHAAFFCWYILWTIDVVKQIRKGDTSIKAFVFYSVSALSASLFRNNCIYLVIPVTLLLDIAVCRQQAMKKHRLRVIALSLAGILVYGGYQVYISRVEQVAGGGLGSAMTIPLQQTARTVRDHGEQITEDEKAAISKVLDYDQLGARYNPILSDPIKDSLHDGKENGIEYLITWAQMAIKHPKAYLEAAIAQSYGYYAFTPDQEEHAGNWNSGMTIFDWVKDPRFAPEDTGDYIAAMEDIRIFLNNWAKIWHALPVLGLLDDLPLYTWFIVCIGLLMIWRRKWINLIPVAACLLAVLFCCGSPVNDCFRYFAPVAAAAPALFLLCKDAAEKRTIPAACVSVQIPRHFRSLQN